jgi:hypothetical protein
MNSVYINQQMHIYKYVQPHIINLHQHVSVTSLTIIRTSYYNNTINIQYKQKKYDKTIQYA